MEPGSLLENESSQIIYFLPMQIYKKLPWLTLDSKDKQLADNENMFMYVGIAA